MYDGSLSVITENFTQAGRLVLYNVQHNLNKNDVLHAIICNYVMS